MVLAILDFKTHLKYHQYKVPKKLQKVQCIKIQESKFNS